MDFVELNMELLVVIEFIGCIPIKLSHTWKTLVMKCANLHAILIDYGMAINMKTDFMYPFTFEPFQSNILYRAKCQQIKHTTLRQFLIWVSIPGNTVTKRFVYAKIVEILRNENLQYLTASDTMLLCPKVSEVRPRKKSRIENGIDCMISDLS